MKVSFEYAVREIHRRPRGFIALAAVSSALLTILIMLVLCMNAAWRADVMPLKPENHNFTVKGLEQLEKHRIAASPWVLAVYDEVEYSDFGKLIKNELHVRVVWSENERALQYAREIFDEYGLWRNEYYGERFENYYQFKYKQFMVDADYRGMSPDTMLASGMTIHEECEHHAKTKVLIELVNNTSYSLKVINTYIIRPEFLIMTILFALFLCGAAVILVSERYRSRMAEFGALRSLGLKKIQLLYICAIDDLLASLASIPIGTALSAVIVKLYSLVFADVLTDDSIYLKLEENLPIGAVLIVALVMTLASLAGCLLVCLLYRNRSVMQLLKKEGSVSVSYVAKTSPRFERAKDERIYQRLAHSRTLRSFILSVAIIVIMMPLPLSYLAVSAEKLFDPSLTEAARAEGYFFLFQSVVLLVTSMCVIGISSRASIELRRCELGILRALGMNRRMIRRTVFPNALRQILCTSLPAVLLYLYVSDPESFSRTFIHNRRLDLELPVILPTLALEMLGVILLITPPILVGVTSALRRFHRHSIVENINGVTVQMGGDRR